MEHILSYEFVLRNVWLIPALPLFSFALLSLLIRPLSARLSGIVATASVMTSAVLSLILAWGYFNIGAAHAAAGGHAVETLKAIIPFSFEWLRYKECLSVSVGVLVDPISVLMMVVVTFVSSLVHLYSIGYMHGEGGYGRYFTFLNLFTFSMLGLVVSPNILQMYVCWELVGVSSFLLIGYYFEKPSAVSASKKAFIVTRFADLGFLLGVLILGYYGYDIYTNNPASPAGIQPFDFSYLTSQDFLSKFAVMSSGLPGLSLITLAMVLVYMGAAGKSAMFPLHIWLPDAMEGPTPVSALIHAATMVVAGVYLVARMFAVFAASGHALLVVAYVGAFTCLFAATIGCTQDDIKRVLAFSTLSQLGYMMFALGVATVHEPLGYTASMFHLFTHAFFKALLFLGAGSVIHAVHNNDIWNMGGLAKKMPVTHITFLIATVSIAGIYPFAGFFSKDEILLAAMESGNKLIFVTGLLVACMTAFYMWRVYFVTFWGKARSKHAEHAHESSFIMLVPLVTLAVFSIASGFIPFADYVHFGPPPAHEGINMKVAVPGTLAGIIGIGLAWFMYARGAVRATAFVAKMGVVYGWIKNKFYFDELYLFITKKLIFNLVAVPVAWFDRHVVDGSMNLAGWLTRMSGGGLRHVQTGQLQTYGVWLVAGTMFILLILWASWI